jgi:hypothetical protein
MSSQIPFSKERGGERFKSLFPLDNGSFWAAKNCLASSYIISVLGPAGRFDDDDVDLMLVCEPTI